MCNHPHQYDSLSYTARYVPHHPPSTNPKADLLTGDCSRLKAYLRRHGVNAFLVFTSGSVAIIAVKNLHFFVSSEDLIEALNVQIPTSVGNSTEVAELSDVVAAAAAFAVATRALLECAQESSACVQALLQATQFFNGTGLSSPEPYLAEAGRALREKIETRFSLLWFVAPAGVTKLFQIGTAIFDFVRSALDRLSAMQNV